MCFILLCVYFHSKVITNWDSQCLSDLSFLQNRNLIIVLNVMLVKETPCVDTKQLASSDRRKKNKKKD